MKNNKKNYINKNYMPIIRNKYKYKLQTATSPERNKQNTTKNTDKQLKTKKNRKKGKTNKQKKHT